MNVNQDRRHFVTTLLAGAALPACANEFSGEGIVPGRVRRLVTGDNAAGEAVLLFQSATLASNVLNDATITRLWETEDTPVALPFTTDRAATAGNAYRKGFSGTSLYIADIPPGLIDRIPMHRQDSVDYIAVMSGEIDLVLDTGAVTMRAGDVLVQGGNMHTWQNRSTDYCRLLVVVLTGVRGSGSPPEPEER